MDRDCKNYNGNPTEPSTHTQGVDGGQDCMYAAMEVAGIESIPGAQVTPAAVRYSEE